MEIMLLLISAHINLAIFFNFFFFLGGGGGGGIFAPIIYAQNVKGDIHP